MKNIIDDGLNPELLRNARFAGVYEMPVIEKPNKMIVPKALIPFSQRKKSKDKSEFIHFYENDREFRDLLYATAEYIDELREFPGVIAPDCSLYRDMPLIAQMTNIYMNRSVGRYLQSQGIYVIPNVRWSDERTYTTNELPEKVAFVGLPKRSVVSIGSYGLMKNKANREHFKKGLEQMLIELDPEIVIVYGSMPESVFGEYVNQTKFVRFQDWISCKRKKAS